MFYRIADVTLMSQIELPSYQAFRCEDTAADATLEIARNELPPEGKDIIRYPIAVRKSGDGWFYHRENEDPAGLLVSGDYTKLRLLRQKDQQISVSEEWFIRIALECLLVRRGFLSLHAACVALDGQAIAFSGPSGAGKSTRAAAWQEAFGAKLLSGDRPLIRADGQEAFGVPWDGKESCYLNARYSLLAILDIRRSASAYIRAMSFRQKRRLLTQQSFLPMWDPDTAALQTINISRLAAKARIVRGFCGPSTSDAQALKRALDAREEYEEASDMKAKENFILREVMGEHIIFPSGENIGKFKGTLLLNEVAAFTWKKLQTPMSRDDLLKAILDEFDVDEAKATADLDDLLQTFRSMGVIED